MSEDPRSLYRCSNSKCKGFSYEEGECSKCKLIDWKKCAGVCGRIIDRRVCSSCRSLPDCGGGCGKKVVIKGRRCSECLKSSPPALTRP